VELKGENYWNKFECVFFCVYYKGKKCVVSNKITSVVGVL
jgi:hypothetical protein